MRAYDIQVEFPPLADPDRTEAPRGKVHIFPAIFLEGDPQFAAKKYIAAMMGTHGLRITAQPAEAPCP